MIEQDFPLKPPRPPRPPRPPFAAREAGSLSSCPSCGGGLRVRELVCETCGTVIQGSFAPGTSGLSRLGPEDAQFAELFVRLRGNIKEVERALGLSYPTVRGMLDRVIERMGYGARSARPGPERRMEILGLLEAGKVSAQDAALMLAGKMAPPAEGGEDGPDEAGGGEE